MVTATTSSSVHTAQDHLERGREYQAQYDTVLRELGMRAPPMTLGKSVNDYRRSVLGLIQKEFLPPTHEFAAMDTSKLLNNKDGRLLDNFEPQFLAAAPKEFRNNANVPPGTIRQVNRLDESGNVRMREFYGRESFVKAMSTPGRRVKSFSQPLQTIVNYNRGNERMRVVA